MSTVWSVRLSTTQFSVRQWCGRVSSQADKMGPDVCSVVEWLDSGKETDVVQEDFLECVDFRGMLKRRKDMKRSSRVWTVGALKWSELQEACGQGSLRWGQSQLQLLHRLSSVRFDLKAALNPAHGGKCATGIRRYGFSLKSRLLGKSLIFVFGPSGWIPSKVQFLRWP